MWSFCTFDSKGFGLWINNKTLFCALSLRPKALEVRVLKGGRLKWGMEALIMGSLGSPYLRKDPRILSNSPFRVAKDCGFMIRWGFDIVGRRYYTPLLCLQSLMGIGIGNPIIPLKDCSYKGEHPNSTLL